MIKPKDTEKRLWCWDNKKCRVHMDIPYAAKVLALYLARVLYKSQKNDKVLLCIGSDRATGDALGPFVGELLTDRDVHIPVYGTLQNPVHAMNLEETLTVINKEHKAPLIIAIDASLGKSEDVGMIKIALQPIKPGAGVKKDLPEVGDISITGIVNIGGFWEVGLLQCTRLYVVVKMATIIADCIMESLVISRVLADQAATVEESELYKFISERERRLEAVLMPQENET